MAIKIAQIQKFSATGRPGRGPDNAKHLFIIAGQSDASLATGSQGANFAITKENFSALVGPKLTKQKVRSSNCDSFICESPNRQRRDGRICDLERRR